MATEKDLNEKEMKDAIPNTEIDEQKSSDTAKMDQNAENNFAENNESAEEIVEKERIDPYDKLKQEYDELHDKYLRLYSDFENFRRRTSKEKIDLIDTANERLILELLPVIDDFERAKESMEKAAEVASVCEGVNLIFSKLKKTLEYFGVKEIECIGEDFNPDIHEAITKIPAPKKKQKGKIIDQVQKGYKIKEKVIRHSKVVVGD